MGLILSFIPIITILAVGAGIWRGLTRFQRFNFRRTEYFNIYLLFGSFFLIIPLTWIGIQPNGIWTLSIGSHSFDLVDFRGWCLLYFLVGLIIAIIVGYFALRKLLDALEDFQFDLGSLRNHQIILLILLLLGYFFLILILPLRGFDALYYYFPEAEVFYQTDRITEANYLSFLPVVKSPLNVLLYVYCYYITSDLSIQIIPFLFLFGLVLLAYDFSLELFDNKSIALTAAIFTLTLPFVYWLINYWAFYQDLFLCYYFSVTCYFSLKWYKFPSNLICGVLMGLGIITSLLTKITGWILPIVLILWLPSGVKGKFVRLSFLLVLGVFLSIQIATKIYIGGSLIIIASLVAASYFIIKEKSPDYSTRTYLRQLPVFAGIIIGSFWLINRISLSPIVWTEIYNLYFRLNRSIKWFYPQQPQEPLLYTLESVHRATFLAAAGILILGTVFVLPWAILKISSLRNFRPITPPLIWLLVFFGTWSTYYLTGSLRYLAPIIIPMILCVTWGFFQLTKGIESASKRTLIEISFAFLGAVGFYYLIPLESLSITNQTQETVGLNYNQAALDYNTFPFLLIRILLTIVFSLLILIYIEKDRVIQLINSIGERIKITWVRKLFQNISSLFKSCWKRINITWISTILLCGVIIIPIVVQSYLLLYTHGNIAEFHAIHEYEYRPEYQQLVTVIQQQNQPLAAILTVRTPGLQFFTKQPTIDIYYQRELFNGDPLFTSTDLAEIMDVLRYPLNYTVGPDVSFNFTISIRFIVVPSTYNIYYDIYITQIKEQSLLFQSLGSNSYFTLLYENFDFQLYEFLHPQDRN